MNQYEGKIVAPDFPQGLEWLNTDKPLSLAQMRGKVVLLDFWTYCCINCIHVLEDIKRLEAKYPRELVVIGVHSGKFTTEKDHENIRQAIMRYEIVHPVINDKEYVIWNQYGVRAWPTLVLIDPKGKIIGSTSGEGVFETFDSLIANVIEEFDGQGAIDRQPLALELERDKAGTDGILAFPGKVLADDDNGQLFIADSNHNRVLIVSPADGNVKKIIGSGLKGFRDGPLAQARFDNPQGMDFDGQKLYVADTGNHAVRVVDFAAAAVTTIAGTGVQGHEVNRTANAREVALNSPWDVVLYNGSLYIAMAGNHQLWVLDLNKGKVGPFAGNGREGREEGPLREASLAQPSGLTTNGEKLYFADSEVSAIRAADLNSSGRVTTVVGGDLFVFGDRDGHGLVARLQHPLGVDYHQGLLYVADTYNNKIKRVDPAQGTIETLVGTGQEGRQDGPNATFDEPGGLSAADGKLYVADTNNHAIRVVDLETRQVETLAIRLPNP